MTMNERTMRRRVMEARVGRLATVTPDGAPHLVPCCFVLAGDTIYTAVDAKPKSTLALRRIANLRANPHASLLVDEYRDDWTQLWWIRVDGSARVIADGPEREKALELLGAKYEQYAQTPPPGAVIAIAAGTWRCWP